MATRYRLGNIRRLLTEGFTPGELRDFSFDTPEFRTVYERLTDNTSADEIVRQILGHADRTEKIELILHWAKKSNLTKYNLHQPYYNNVRILLVDDNTDWREQFGKLLQEQGHGYEVITAASREEAQRRINNDKPYNLAILDMRLDEADEENREGVVLGFWLRENGHTMPVFILSAYEIESKIAKYIGLRPFQFIAVEKGNIGVGGFEDLLRQIELALLS